MVCAPATDAALEAWEQANGLTLAGKGVALLALALPGTSLSELSALTLSQRDGALLELRAHLFGRQIRSVAACPACGDKAELTFDVDDVRDALRREAAPAVPPDGNGAHFSVRAATCGDLLAVDHLAPGEPRRTALMHRCIRGSTEEEDSTPVDLAVRADLADSIAACDPAANLQIPLTCLSCGKAWSSRFEVVRFLWQELDAWAQRMLAEVHLLACAYGWAERTIISMSPWRRQAYLEMLRQ
jgi:hypothetical protein